MPPEPAEIEEDQAMIANLLNALFGCRHKRLTRPITAVHKPGTQAEDTYVTCLDCGRRFHYDTAALRIGAPIAVPPAAYGPLSRPYQVQ